MLALCMAHKDFVDIIEEAIIKDSKTFGFRCVVKRMGRADKISEFTLENAKTADYFQKVVLDAIPRKNAEAQG